MGDTTVPVWPRTATPPLTGGQLRAQPEDFVVIERMSIELTGGGEHLWLRVRKRGWNTEDVARWLAQSARLPRRDVGYAGMKDRRAVTEQWFSLYLAGRADPDWPSLPGGIEILESHRHERKLRTGALAGNEFVVVLRHARGEPDVVARRVETMVRDGVPNYFGEQRFGHDGKNVANAQAMLAGRRRARNRHEQGIWLSAARSLLFNEVLAARVRDGTWNRLLPGEACALAGSHSFFVIESPDRETERRLGEHDIHPSGPMWGTGELPSRRAARDLEQRVVEERRELAAALAGAGLRQERRPLRLIPESLVAREIDGGWEIRFGLPAGSYATVVLREIADFQVMQPEDGA